MQPIPSSFMAAIPQILITWPTSHICHYLSMEHFTEPALATTDSSDKDSPMRDCSPSLPVKLYQPRPSGSKTYELKAYKQPTLPWQAWLSQPILSHPKRRSVSPSSEKSTSKHLHHKDGSYTLIMPSTTSLISLISPSVQAVPDYQNLPSPQSVKLATSSNVDSPPMQINLL